MPNPTDSSYRRYFTDRRDAGRLLAGALSRYADANPLVLALPRGGVPVAFEIARCLGAQLDLLLVAKLSAPSMPGLAIGAVGALPATPGAAFAQRVVNPDVIAALKLPTWYVESEARVGLSSLRDQRRRYVAARSAPSLKGRTVIVVDDCVASGATARAALDAAWVAGAARRVLAVPVAPRRQVELLKAECDDFVCLLAPGDSHALGYYFGDFDRVDDLEVTELLGCGDAQRVATPGPGGRGH